MIFFLNYNLNPERSKQFIATKPKLLFINVAGDEESDRDDDEESETTDVQGNQAVLRNDTISQIFLDAVKKIRFLTMDPKQFAENVPRTNLLTKEETFAVLMNISSPNTIPMPEGFSTSKDYRFGNSDGLPQNIFNGVGRHSLRFHKFQTLMDAPEPRRYYCRRTIFKQMNNFFSECAFTFTVSQNISITGIQLCTQSSIEHNKQTQIKPLQNKQLQNRQLQNLPNCYSESLYAQLFDSLGKQLTYTHYKSILQFDSLVEISFGHSVLIEQGSYYKIAVRFDKRGWYTMSSGLSTVVSEGICFDFLLDSRNGYSINDGLIRSIVFKRPPSNDGQIF